ncbi:MAG: M24 family metallopeptidase [Chlamydiae bacterium]|nr:M24 family metallopeptidase [Chlamydiota bacterium]
MQSRLLRLQDLLQKYKVDACVIEEPKDLLYFTGIAMSAGRLWVHSKKVALFVDGRYREVCIKNSVIQPVFESKAEVERDFLRDIHVKKALFDGASTSFSRAAELKHFLHASVNGAEDIAIDRFTMPLRMMKGAVEIHDLKQSIRILKKAYRHLQTTIQTGISEQALAQEFEVMLRRLGAQDAAFDPIIAFEKNTAMPHYRAGRSKLKQGQMILFDLGVVYEHYHSDMTRVMFHGIPNPRLLRLVFLVKQAHKAAVALCKPGITFGQLDTAARQVFREHNVEEYFVHSLGHGIGLDTHEMPTIRFQGIHKDMELQSGMVFTIEPGLYIPGVGGARWEDMILITDKGHENLTEGI